jgi:type II secretory pathway component PulF
MIVVGERAGRLADAIQQAHEILRDQDDRKRRLDPSLGPYAFSVVGFMCSILIALMVVIIPKLDEIFRDFDVKSPPLLTTVMDFVGFIAYGPIPRLVLLLVLVAPFFMAYFKLRPRRTPVPYYTSQIADAVRWYTPGLRGMHRGFSMATMFGNLRSLLRSGIGLPNAARLAAGVDVNWYARQRMVRFADLVAQGTNAGRAARDARLGALAASTLENGQRSGDFDAALRYLADYYASLVGRWWLVYRNMAWPVCTLVLGTLVGIVVLGMFTPLVTLIQAMCDSTGF